MQRLTILSVGTLFLAFSPWTPTARAATDSEKQAAIRKGLAYLYKMQQAEGFWSYSGYERSTTGAATFALLSQQNNWESQAAPYQTAVDKAISYLLKEASVTDVGLRDDGAYVCPNGEATCRAVAWYDSHDSIYTTGFVAPAIAIYGLKAGSGAVATTSGPLAGMTWAEVAQGITNAYAASQSASNSGNPGGAWRRTAPGSARPDGWTTQPAVISFLYDQLLGAVTPLIVKNGLKGWLTSVEDASGNVCYAKSGAEPCELSNVGEWLLAAGASGNGVPEAQVDAVLAGLNHAWPSTVDNAGRGNFGHPYTMWTVYSSLDGAIGLRDSTHINNFLTDCGASANSRPSSLPGQVACTWVEDYDQWLVKEQQPDGSWTGRSYWTGPMATALYVNILGAVEIPKDTYKCPVRQAFWQNARAAWPVESLTLGNQAYSRNELTGILSTPVDSGGSGDASLVLADELIIARLNVAKGAERHLVTDRILNADALLRGFNTRLPYFIDASSVTGQKMMEQANLLDLYNNGTMTPGCVSNETSNGAIGNRQLPDTQTQRSPSLTAENRDGNAIAAIDNAQRAHAAAAASKPLPFIRKGATSIALSPDGNSLATASTDNTIRMWNPTNGQQSLLFSAALTFPTDLAFRADGATLHSVGRDSLVHVFDAVSGRELARFAGHEAALRAVAISPNSRLVASAGEETRIMLWDAIANKLSKILVGSADFLDALAFSPDSTLLASGGEDARVRLFDVATGKIRYTLLGHSGSVDAVAFSPDGNTLASAGQDTVIHVWDAVNGIQRRALAGHQAPIRTLAFSPDGQLMASGGEDTRIILWDTTTGGIKKILSGSTGAVNQLVFSPKGPFLINGTDTGEISTWNVATGIKMFTFVIPN
jgi:hypothetical protein